MKKELNLLDLGVASLVFGGVGGAVSMPLFAIGGAVVGSGCVGYYVYDKLCSKMEKIEQIEPIEEYDIFKYIKVENNLKESPRFITNYKKDADSIYIYSLPKGLGYSDFNENKIQDKIRASLDIKGKLKISIKNNQLFLIDSLSLLESFYQFENIKVNKNIFEFYVGKFVHDGRIENLLINFKKNPHLLIGGITGGGKSSILRTIMTSVLLNYSADDLEIDNIDLKGVELNLFEDCAHVPRETVTEIEEVLPLLEEIYREFKRRKKLFNNIKKRDIFSYNKAVKHSERLKYRLIVIDEVAQLMGEKEIKKLLIKLIAVARAFGIYFILCTQRPSKEVIDGDIKCNISNTIGLMTSKSVDSRVIIDEDGLEQIIYKGRGLLKSEGKIKEFQGAYIGNPQIEGDEEIQIDKLLKHLYKSKEEKKTVDAAVDCAADENEIDFDEIF